MWLCISSPLPSRARNCRTLSLPLFARVSVFPSLALSSSLAVAGQTGPQTPQSRTGILAQVQAQAQQAVAENRELRHSLQEAEERSVQQEAAHKQTVAKMSSDAEALKVGVVSVA